MTCCMRESLELSWPLGGPNVALLWLVTARPATALLQVGKITVSAMHWLSGRLPAGWFARGGTAYSLTAIVDSARFTDGDEPFSDAVLLIVHIRIWSLAPSLLKTASELRKYSLPLLAV